MGRSIISYQNPTNQNPGVSAIDSSPSELPAVDFSPAEVVRHQTAHWRGVQVKTVQIISHEPFEYSFKQQCHLLVAVEQGVRYDGETFVEGLPTSTIRNYSDKLIFVPAGRRFYGAQKPRLLTRSICLYMDPQAVPVDPDLRFAEAELQPRLLFEDSGLAQQTAYRSVAEKLPALPNPWTTTRAPSRSRSASPRFRRRPTRRKFARNTF